MAEKGVEEQVLAMERLQIDGSTALHIPAHATTATIVNF